MIESKEQANNLIADLHVTLHSTGTHVLVIVLKKRSYECYRYVVHAWRPRGGVECEWYIAFACTCIGALLSWAGARTPATECPFIWWGCGRISEWLTRRLTSIIEQNKRNNGYWIYCDARVSSQALESWIGREVSVTFPLSRWMT